MQVLDPQAFTLAVRGQPPKMTTSLPILDSCDDCGACCRVVSSPPFRRVFDEAGEEAWERLRWDRPDLLAELLAIERTRKRSGDPSFGSPCHWFDPESKRCRHHDLRPRACREFEVGGVDCHDARRRQQPRPNPGPAGDPLACEPLLKMMTIFE